jgi:hypothetical protein
MRRQVQRAFHGRLVGLPYDPEPEDVPAAPTPVATAEPIVSAPPPTKCGRKPKGDRAMTPQERKVAQRTREKRTKEAPERDQLIRGIVRRIKTSEHGSIEAMKRALSKFRDVLDVLSLDDLREIAAQYSIHDLTGRSSLEGHSGTVKLGKEFVARLENIERKHISQELYGGSKPSMGAAPDASEAEEGDGTPTSSRVSVKPSEITVWDLMPEITESLFEGDEENLWDVDESTLHRLPTLRCRACKQMFCTWVEARTHTEVMVKGGENLVQRIKILEEAAKNSFGYDGLLVGTRRKYTDEYWKHHRSAVNFVTRRKRRRKDAKLLTRLGIDRYRGSHNSTGCIGVS